MSIFRLLIDIVSEVNPGFIVMVTRLFYVVAYFITRKQY